TGPGPAAGDRPRWWHSPPRTRPENQSVRSAAPKSDRMRQVRRPGGRAPAATSGRWTRGGKVHQAGMGSHIPGLCAATLSVPEGRLDELAAIYGAVLGLAVRWSGVLDSDLTASWGIAA